jgi:hypothetical protein
MKTKILATAGLVILILCCTLVASNLAPVPNGISQISCCINNAQSVPCESEEPNEPSDPNDPNKMVPE